MTEKSEPDTLESVHIRLEGALLKKIKAAADAADRPIAREIRGALKEFYRDGKSKSR